jgi:hypothetical protein
MAKDDVVNLLHSVVKELDLEDFHTPRTAD